MSTFGEAVKTFDVSLNKRLLLGVRPVLELGFTFLGGRPRFVTFRIDDTHRQSTCGVLRATTFIVNALALDDVGCRADVERAIGTGGDVDEVGRGGRRWCLALRLLLDSRGTGCSLGVAQDHSPRPVRQPSLAFASRMGWRVRCLHDARLRVEWLAMSEALMVHGPSRMAEAPGSRTQPPRRAGSDRF
jgi:hypothetical protein